MDTVFFSGSIENVVMVTNIGNVSPRKLLHYFTSLLISGNARDRYPHTPLCSTRISSNIRKHSFSILREANALWSMPSSSHIKTSHFFTRLQFVTTNTSPQIPLNYTELCHPSDHTQTVH
jgi:hypothetical protein